MKEPKIELTRYQRLIENMMHTMIIVLLVALFLKVLVI